MWRLAFSVLVVTLASSSIAGARPNATTMTCEQAAATVARAGAIVLSTGVHTYERFVASNQFCMRHELIDPGFAPTLDSRKCQVGYVCRRPDWLDND
jgi:hypothetical protein